MARIFITIDDRPRPALTTPPLGGDGDLCDRTCEAECRIDNIIRKYGEVLPQAMRVNAVDIDMSDVPDDPIDKLAYIKALKERLAAKGLGTDGSIIDIDKYKAALPKVVNLVDGNVDTVDNCKSEVKVDETKQSE